MLIFQPDEVQKLVDSVFVDQVGGGPAQVVVTPEPVKVQVQNGAGVEGLAARVVSYIIGKGYPANDLNPANVFDGASHAKSEVIDLDGTHEKNGFLLANWLNIPDSSYRKATPERASRDVRQRRVHRRHPRQRHELRRSSIQSPTTSTPGG